MSKNPTNVLIVGSDSLIGKKLSNKLTTLHNIETFSIAGGKCFNQTTILENFNLRTEPSNQFNRLLRNYTSIIFLSGITNTKYIADNYVIAKKINLEQTIKWIRFLTQNGAPIIFPSTSLVYHEQYLPTEQAITQPITTYGQLKLEVEQVLQDLDISVALPRFTKVVSLDQPLFQNWIESLKKKDHVKAYLDCKICPIAIDQATDVLVKLATNLTLQNVGPINISGSTDVSFFSFASLLAKSLNLNPELVVPTDSGGEFTSKQIFATLETKKAIQLFNFAPQSPEEVVEFLRKEYYGLENEKSV